MHYSTEIKRIYSSDGLKGFTRGYTGMLMRDAPGFGLYFSLFEFNKRMLGIPHDEI